MPATPRKLRPASREQESAAPSLPAWAPICFLMSGAAGLLYEVAWSKQFSYLLGNSLHAVSTVVAGFLCGLALGARFVGVPLSRRGDGARQYARLELGVALLGVLSLPLLRGLDPLVGTLYRSLGGETTAFGAARVLLLFVLLIPPAALMGATLPVLVGHVESRRVGAGLARLYAINTIGAVLGSAAAGFLLLPAIGLLATTWVAAALNLLAGILAWRAGGAGTQAAVDRAADAAMAPGGSRTARLAGAARSAHPPDTQQDASGPLQGRRWQAFCILFAASGFAALVFQIAWVRLFSLVFGSSVYSFSAVLGVYLLGLALGSALIARFMRRGVSLTGFGWLQLALAAVTALELHAFRRLPEWMFEITQWTGASWSARLACESGLAALLLLPPCALLGATFPIATRLLQREGSGQAAGHAYAVNTVGTIAGSLLAGFWAVPTLGVQGTHLAAVLCCTVIGIAAIALGGAARLASREGLLAGAGVAVVALLAFSAPSWDPALMSMGSFRPRQASQIASSTAEDSGDGRAVWHASRAEKVLYYHEGVNGTVYVASDADGRERWMRIGGKTDASTGDMDTQVLLGLIPGALAEPGARALVIGQGSGVTLASVLAAGAGPTELLELEPGVLEASRFFHAPGEDPLDDPRVTVIVGDARTRLAHGDAHYDLIVSQPSNPWLAGINNLFTVDFYRLVRERLQSDGVFCQWMQLYELSAGTFHSMVASFLEVFPEAQVFMVLKSGDVLLVAAPPGRHLALERLASPAASRLLAQARLGSAESIASRYAGPLAALREVVRDAPLNLDDRPIVEYRAPKDLIAVGAGATGFEQSLVASIPFAATPPAGRWFQDWTDEGWHEARVQGLLDQGELERASLAIRHARAAGFAALADRLAQQLDAGARRSQAAQLIAQSQAQLGAGQTAEGLATLTRATEVDPSNCQAWLMLADLRRLAGDFDGADAAIIRGSGSEDVAVRADAANLRGIVEMARGRNARAVESFHEAQGLSPALPQSYLLEAQACLADADRPGARAALQRGLEHAPGDAPLLAALRELDSAR